MLRPIEAHDGQCTRGHCGGILLDDVIVQVPEPSAFVLAGLGLLGMGVVARRNTYRRV